MDYLNHVEWPFFDDRHRKLAPRIDAWARNHLRTSVAAAALGFARHALREGLQRAAMRHMFGQTLGDFQLTQAKLAQRATTIDSAALLVYRAAWLRDQGRNVTREAAMAKMSATEGAQQVIDAAVQLWGGQGVALGTPVEQWYREIRALRIYEVPLKCNS
ncbi:Acyl-CoA dehydrogenase, C-terminal domain [Burkholderia sp. b14]|nr:Acyl-CoA dehydrogenase, C-terminal domain [Burkholderia sp. b14]